MILYIIWRFFNTAKQVHLNTNRSTDFTTTLSQKKDPISEYFYVSVVFTKYRSLFYPETKRTYIIIQ